MKNNDTILVEKIRRKDHASFLKLYDRYWDDLYDMVFARTNHKEATEEILQNLWVRVWTEPDFLNIDEEGSASGFLFRYAHYRVKDYYRNRKSEATPDEIGENVFEISDSEYFEILDHHTTSELMTAIREVVATMTETEQKVFDLRVNKKKSVSETAELLEMNNKTVSNHLSRVFGEIRQRLGPEYETSKKLMVLIAIMEGMV